jgi:hypothetical protein
MVKANKFMLFGMAAFLMVFSLAFASATTLVAGKIYNSDFTELIQGATVTITCGPYEDMRTESIADGTYAVNFVSVEGCQLGDTVQVSASKGDLSGNEDSTIRESQDDGAEFVSVANIGIKAPSSGSGGSKKKSGGTWFMCGNTVCDSGETHETCAEDCPAKVVVQVNPTPEPEETEVIVTEYADGTNTKTDTANLAGITGAVIGDGSGKSKLPMILGSFILLLIMVILAMNIVKNVKKGDSEVPKGNQSKFY